MKFTPINRVRLAYLALAGCLFSGHALANEKGFYIHAGAGHVALEDDFSGFAIGGIADPGADASVTDPSTLIINGGYQIREQWSVSFTAGLPVDSTASGQGTLAPLGELGEITFGVAGLHLNRHFNTGSNFQPFFGAGLAYGIIFDTADGALTNVDVGNEFGLELRAGFDYRINKRFGVYFGLAKAMLEFDIEGTATTPVGPAPATVKAALDPMLIQSGVSYRF